MLLKKLSHRKGMVLVWAVYAVVLLMLLGNAFLDMVIINYDLIIRASRQIQTAWIAEAGIARAYHDVQKDFFNVASKYQGVISEPEPFGGDVNENEKEDGLYLIRFKTDSVGRKRPTFFSQITSTGYLIEKDKFKRMSKSGKEKVTRTSFSSNVNVYSVITDYALYVNRPNDRDYANGNICYYSHGVREFENRDNGKENLWFSMENIGSSYPEENPTLMGPVFFNVPHLKLTTNVFCPDVKGPVLSYTGTVGFEDNSPAVYSIVKDGDGTEGYTKKLDASNINSRLYETTGGAVLDPYNGAKLATLPKTDENAIKKFYKNLIDKSWHITSRGYEEIPDYTVPYKTVNIDADDNTVEKIRQKLSTYLGKTLVEPITFHEYDAMKIENVGGVSIDEEFNEPYQPPSDPPRPEPGTYPYDVEENQSNWDGDNENPEAPPEHGTEGTDPNDPEKAKPKDYGPTVCGERIRTTYPAIRTMTTGALITPTARKAIRGTMNRISGDRSRTGDAANRTVWKTMTTTAGGITGKKTSGLGVFRRLRRQQNQTINGTS